jgi:hypothetical protein
VARGFVSSLALRADFFAIVDFCAGRVRTLAPSDAFGRMIFRVQFLDVSARHRVVERLRATDQK